MLGVTTEDRDRIPESPGTELRRGWDRYWEMGSLGPPTEVLAAHNGVQPTPIQHLVLRGPAAWPRGSCCHRGERDN